MLGHYGGFLWSDRQMFAAGERVAAGLLYVPFLVRNVTICDGATRCTLASPGSGEVPEGRRGRGVWQRFVVMYSSARHLSASTSQALRASSPFEGEPRGYGEQRGMLGGCGAEVSCGQIVKCSRQGNG